MFRGALVATVTPFREGRVDEEAVRRLVGFYLEGGAEGLVPCGTTGEGATLSAAEFELVVRATVEEAGGRVPVVAGTGGNNTALVIEQTRRARELGTEAALVVSPPYNKPTQEGIYQHYKAVVEGARFPVVVYNVPGRTAGNVLPETIERLADLPEIVAVKEASGSLDQITELVGRLGDRVAVLSGDDGLNLPIAAVGGRGAISVLANLVPGEVARLFKGVEDGDLGRARKLHHRYHRLVKALFIETNPLPVKTALAMKGLCQAEFRLPLCPMAAENQQKLRDVLSGYGLLDG